MMTKNVVLLIEIISVILNIYFTTFSVVDNEKVHFEQADLQEKSIILMLYVLSRVTHMKPDSPEMSLGSKRSLIVLLKYLRESTHPSGRIQLLLTKVVRYGINVYICF